jgi:hemoglobin-like flavoprotein
MGVTRHPLFDDSGRLGGVPVDTALARRLRESLQRVLGRDDKLIDRFYARLFAENPELRSMFPTDMTAQKAKIEKTLHSVASGLDTPGMLSQELAKLGRLHHEVGTRPEHYPLVCGALLAAMTETRGGEFDAETARDWQTALARVSAIMMAGARKPPPQ